MEAAVCHIALMALMLQTSYLGIGKRCLWVPVPTAPLLAGLRRCAVSQCQCCWQLGRPGAVALIPALARSPLPPAHTDLAGGAGAVGMVLPAEVLLPSRAQQHLCCSGFAVIAVHGAKLYCSFLPCCHLICPSCLLDAH